MCCGELTKFCMALHVEEDVSSFNVTVNLAFEVQVLQSPQSILQYDGYLLLLEL